MRVTLTLTADIALNCESGADIVEHIRRSFENAIGDGALTGHTMAEVNSWEMTVDKEA